MQPLRAILILTVFVACTLPLMPLQWAFVRLRMPLARSFPNWYHRWVCRLLGVRIHVEGPNISDTPALLVSNHSSWLDIPVLSAVAPVSFIAKKEVSGWPFVGSLARLQRSVFVDRQRRTAVGRTTNEISERLAAGDHVVLFAEGTSSDGNRVLPFKSSLFAAAEMAAPVADGPATPGEEVVVQTLAIAYVRLHGLPIGRAGRPKIAWYGDMEMAGHAWDLLGSGPIDVHIRFGPAMPINAYSGRKALARETEAAVRADVTALLRQSGALSEPQEAAMEVGRSDRLRRVEA